MAFSLEPVTPALGAVVHGVDLSKKLDNSTFSGIWDAFNKHSVLVFPDQHITPEQHIAFSSRFGELMEHVLREDLLEGHPEIYIISNKKKPDGGRLGRPEAGWYWHTDLSYENTPSVASHMYALEVPSSGGDTMFASSAAAYDGLSEPMKKLVDGLTAEHDFRHAYDTFIKPRGGAPISDAVFEARPPVVHPMVRTHPDTGRRSLYVNEGFTRKIMGMHRDESRALLDFLYRHSTRSEYVLRHRWSQYDFVMWDNRGTQHCALGDYNEDRLMYRTTMAGDIIE
ncbi:MAG: TauD/TfdA family dioxygenase [Rhodospirillaceae bacterium]